MATTATAQYFMVCNVCETSPVQMYCNSCAIKLCNECVSKHISDDTEKYHHDVVLYKKKNAKQIFPRCKTHEDQTCEMKCQQCDIPVCAICVTSRPHKKHNLLAFLELFKSQKDIIKQKTTDLETYIYPRYENAISELETQLQNLPQIYDSLISMISNQGEEWHREVDIIINRQREKVRKMKTDDLATLKKLLEEMKNLLSTLRQAIMENNDILQSADVTKVLDSKFTSPEMWDSPPSIDVTPPLFKPLPIKGEQLNLMFGTLTAASMPSSLNSIKAEEDKLYAAVKQLKLLDSPESSSSIHTRYKYQHQYITCLSPEEVWVCGENCQIKRFNISGSLQETVTITTGHSPKGITVSRQGDLIYTDDRDRSVNRVRCGKIEKIISLQRGWTPRRVCCTDADELLVTMGKDNTPSRIVRYSGSTEKQVIQFDDQGKPLFSSDYYGLFITDKSDKNMICVSDTGMKTVVVVNQAGKLRFRYTGNLSSHQYKSFFPRGVVIDSMGHMLVADEYNDCIHIIDQQGHFVRYIGNCQLSEPWDLSLDRNNTLYVAESKTAKVMIIKYLK